MSWSDECYSKDFKKFCLQEMLWEYCKGTGVGMLCNEVETVRIFISM